MPGTIMVIKEKTGLVFMELTYSIFIFKELFEATSPLGLYLSIQPDWSLALSNTLNSPLNPVIFSALRDKSSGYFSQNISALEKRSLT